ncbi:MAG TPA: ATP-binding protein [Chloroflexota bacterium]|jgi:PAS domain S-box-containing protein|nr:ATP-binding protein [Chloroflexota bacterium]
MVTNQAHRQSPVTPYLTEVLRHLPDGITVVDDSGHIVYANDTGALLCGCASVDELLTTTIADLEDRFEIVDEHGLPIPAEERGLIRQGEWPPNRLIRFRDRVSGEERWSSLSSSRIVDPETGARLAISIFHDVTKQTKADLAIRFLAEAGTLLASSLYYDVTLASLTRLAVPRMADWCSVTVIGQDGEAHVLDIAHVDPKRVANVIDIGRRVPYDPNAKYGAPRVIRTGEPELFEEIAAEMLEEAAPDPETLQAIRGLGLLSSMTVPLVARGKVLGAISLVTAESGRRFDKQDLALGMELARRAALAVDNAQLYREALRSNAELQGILAQMTDPVIVADAAGIVTFANDAANQVFGRISIGAPVALARPASTYFTLEGDPIPPDEMVLQRAVRGELVTNFVWLVRRAGVPDRVLQTSAVPLEGDDGTQLGALTVSRDVTELYDFERKKDAFLVTASHDLKNPLTLVKGTAQLLEQRLSRRETLGKDLIAGLQSISGTASRMSAMVDEMLDVARIQMGRPLALDPAPVDLVSLLERTVSEFRAGSERNPIELTVDSRPIDGNWDRLRVERVFSNLIANSAKFSAEGSPIRIQVWRAENAAAPAAMVAVSDQGVGIPADDLPLIFEHFHRGENVVGTIAGTGIGLAGVKQIVEQHGGTIQVESEENRGSTFTVSLPL